MLLLHWAMERPFARLVGLEGVNPVPVPLVVTYILLQTADGGGGFTFTVAVAGVLVQPFASIPVTV